MPYRCLMCGNVYEDYEDADNCAILCLGEFAQRERRREYEDNTIHICNVCWNEFDNVEDLIDCMESHYYNNELIKEVSDGENKVTKLKDLEKVKLKHSTLIKVNTSLTESCIFGVDEIYKLKYK